GPYDDYKLGLHKVAKYYYYPALWEGGAAIHAFTNLEKWNSLPDSYKRILADACSTANQEMQAKYDVLNPPTLRSLVAEGAELRGFNQQLLEACYEAALELYADLSAKN